MIGCLGYRKHWKVFGRPDFAWPGRKIAVFVDGCFWHGCPQCYSRPKTNQRFWKGKLEANQGRDEKVNKVLSTAGWKVLRVWECRIQDPAFTARIRELLKKKA